jgi:hypothetical protein
MQKHLHVDPRRLFIFAKLEAALTSVEAQHLQTCSGCLDRYVDFRRQIIKDALPAGAQMMGRPAPRLTTATERETA